VVSAPAGEEARGPGAVQPVAVARVAPVAGLPAQAEGPGIIRPRSTRVVGIDLGTTHACVAVARNGRAQVLASRLGHRTMPSVVAFDEQGCLLVGHPAKAQQLVNPEHTVYGFKRLVGRAFASPAVQACRDRFHYRIVEGRQGGTAVRFAGREFTLEQVAALVLTELREVACQALGETVERAVIAVPANYNDLQREAVREAAALAGLEVERLVNEPIGAALAFGYGKDLAERVLVYDLGGGTFDAAVVRVTGDLYEILSTGGDPFLGGADFDAQLVDHLAWTFTERHGTGLPLDRVVWQRLHAAAEELKIILSDRDRALVRLPGLGQSEAGAPLDLEVELTRARLEALTDHLVARTLGVCREVLEARQLAPGDVQEVLLVGGQSRMPLVWSRARALFGRDPSRGVHPEEAVAIGAALLGDSAGRIDAPVLLDALSTSIGVGMPGGKMLVLMARQLRLPARRGFELTTSHDGQSELELRLYQGDSAWTSGCTLLGRVRVTGLPPAPRGTVRVAVEVALGAEGILSVTARDLSSGKVTSAELPTRDAPASPAPLPGATPDAGEVAAGAGSDDDEGPSGRTGFLARLLGRTP
jgi:molecular chaperone DnaK